MALALLFVTVWLFEICAFSQPVPPITQIPLPLIEFKLGVHRQILTSDRNRKLQWQELYTNAEPEPVTSDIPVFSANGTALPSYDTAYIFNQLIDHNYPNNGTFSQRYYFTYEYYQPGGPIFFSVPSESSLDNYDGAVTNSSLTGYLAQQNHGAAVVLEHRFFGLSNPYPDLSEESLSVLTVEQAIADIAFFVQNVHLPMPNGTKVGPDKVPWVLIGGSYPGALVAWTMTEHPNLFAAGWASSAVLQSQSYFWSYFDIISQFMPANCSADVRAVVDHLDKVFTTGTPADQAAAKAVFALSNVLYGDDVMAAIRAPIFSWQDMQPYFQDTNGGFYAFCNYLEYDRTKKMYDTSGNGVGLANALNAYGNWNQYEVRVAGCTGIEESCYGTHIANSSATWTNTTVNNHHRSWAWLYCNQLGWFFSGAPPNWPTITSRLTTPDSEARVCSLYFPKRFPMGTTAAQMHNDANFNMKYGGWDVQTTNIFYANGRRDPWRGVTLSSDLYNRVSTPSQPIAVADGGYHCSDLVMQAGQYDASVAAVQKLGSAYIYKWLSQWYTAHPNVTRPANVTVFADPSTIPMASFVAKPIPANIMQSSWQSNITLLPQTPLPTGPTQTPNPQQTGTGTTNNQNSPNGAPRIRVSPWTSLVLCLSGTLFWTLSA